MERVVKNKGELLPGRKIGHISPMSKISDNGTFLCIRGPPRELHTQEALILCHPTALWRIYSDRDLLFLEILVP